MSLSKNLIPSDDAQTVRATGKGVIEIDLLPPKVVKNCRFLYVSYNSISNLQNITQFRFMQSLMIEYNLIETIEALYPLAQLTKLRTIRLEGNPVCFLPLWELQLIKICPQIVYINGMDVNTILKSKESRIKLDYLELERNFIQVIYLAEYVCRSIEIVLQHPEMSFTDSNNLVDLPPEEEFSQQVRKRCRNARPNQYMSQLKGIIIETHKRVQELSNSCPAIPKTSIRQHRKVLATASQKNSVLQFTEAVDPLSSAALFLVGIGDGVQLSPDDCMSVTSQMSRKSIVSTASTASTSSRARSVLKGVKKVNDAQKRRPSGSTANSQIKDEENINNNPNGEFEVDMNNTYNDDNMQHSDDDYDENDQKLNKNQNEGEEEEFNEDNINKHNSDINSNTNQQNSKNNKENIEMNQNEEEDNLDSVDENDQDKNHGNRNGINEEEENDDENTNKDNENLEEEEDYDDEVDDINGFQQKNDVNSKNSGSTGKNSQNEDGKLQSNAKNYGKNGLSDENDEDRDQSNNLSQKNKLNGNQTAGNGKNSGKNSYSDENDEEKENSFDNLQKNGLNGNKSATNGKNGSNGQGSDENQSDYNNSENDPNQSLEKEGKLDKNGQTNSNEYNSDDNLLKGAHSKQNQNEEEEDNLSGEENDQNIGNKRKSHYFDEEEDLYNDNPNYSKEDEINLDSNDHPKSSFHSFELEELRAQQEAEENDYEEEDFNFEEVEPPKYDGSKRNIRKYVDSAEQVTMPLLTLFTQTPSNIYNSRASQISQPTDNMASQTNTTPLKASDIRQIASVSDDDDNDKLFEIDDEIDNEEMKDNDEEIQKYNDLKNDALRLIQMSEEEETNQNINDLQKVTQNSEEEETNPKSKKYNKFNQNSDEEIPKSNKFNVYMNMFEEEDELNPKSKNYKNISQKQKNLSEEDDELNPKSKNYKNISQKQKNLSEEDDELNPKSKNYKDISQKQKNLSEEDDELNPKSKNYKNISQKQKNLSEEDDELNPKSKNYKNISQKQKNLSEEDDELNPKSKKFNGLQKVTQNSEEEETNPKSKKYNKFNQNSDEEIPKSNKFNVYMNMFEEEDELNPKSKNYKNISQKQKNLSEEDDELNPKSKNYKNISQKQKNLSEEDDELNPKSKNYKDISQKQKNLSEEDDELNPKSKNYKNISQKQKNLSEEDDELNPKSKNYKNISQKQKNLSEEDDELNPKSKKFNGLQKVTQNSEKEKPKSKKYNKLSEEEDNVNPKSKSKIEQQNEEDINSISPQSSQIKEENEQKNTPENKSGKKVVLSDVSPQFRPSFAVGRSKNKKDIPKVNFDSDDLNNNKQLENEKSLQTSEFKNNEENSPNESDILFNAKGNKASPHTSDILFNDDIETKENNNEIEDVQINNVIDSLTPLNSDVLRQIEHLDPASNSSNDGDKKKDLSVVELAKTIEQKELTDSETKMSSNSFDGTDEDNKLLQEFASTEPLMNSAARFGEPSSPSSIKKDMNKPETNISLKSKKKVNIEKVDQKTKNDDEKMALSDIRNVTDGSNFDASLGTSDNGRRRPKSILKTSSTSPINKENTKRITFVPQNTSETMSGENYSGVEPVLILRNVVKNYDLMDKFFSKWKGEYKKRTQQMSSVISDIQTQAHSAIIEERKSKTISIMPINSIQSNFDTIKQIAIKHELIRKIDVQRDINEKLRERYEQAKRELAARQSSKPIPQSPMFNRSSAKQTRVDDDVINFAMSTRASVRQSTNTRVRTSLTTSGNPQGRITHMDILRLQMGM
ncbi:Leucine Rich Repeat family protein [Trichomonas vaginalis G3]|uniref:Leucine Rich Repeat family protein n=1 Tax=Trichomonas vaginalis (strain ATCC PRA-98 / G3) TaxID=412133 RepID=A2DAH7_TRIV3|nr:uncharacterized protein TVAGG3_0811060 [Trichomonas vaginalis G3]EAY22480.1 Leucine Rich Repeat family protein [Trichomonas vaginalis G3]KAI5497205.1 hypothetical protein TVAGG3_0811060 [Trichomonas vaginalis G3]|eukprot:XP_001583466.1 hypothetical protein [Trichomonas vaginalis G3]